MVWYTTTPSSEQHLHSYSNITISILSSWNQHIEEVQTYLLKLYIYSYYQTSNTREV